MAVFVQTRKFFFFTVLLCSLALALYILRMIRERHVILKAMLQSRLLAVKLWGAVCVKISTNSYMYTSYQRYYKYSQRYINTAGDI